MVVISNGRVDVRAFRGVSEKVVRDFSMLGSDTSVNLCNGHNTGKIVLIAAHERKGAHMRSVDAFARVGTARAGAIPSFLIAKVIASRRNRPGTKMDVIIPGAAVNTVASTGNHFHLGAPGSDCL